jgi:hypothetical protein
VYCFAFFLRAEVFLFLAMIVPGPKPPESWKAFCYVLANRPLGIGFEHCDPVGDSLWFALLVVFVLNPLVYAWFAYHLLW